MEKVLKFMLRNLKKVCFPALFTVLAFSFSAAQSTSQNTPSPVTTNEISGTIPARSLGDSRLTNYFYAFNGNQGDVFVNIVTKNLDGDIDIFTVEGLRPLTKITVFSDNAETETGRIVYLRKFEKLLLRIQGRSPDDNPAAFRIKFAGSFQPLEGVAGTEEVKVPEVNSANQGEIRVNSVGTIIAVVPKPTPAPKEIAENPSEMSKPETPVSPKEITVTSVEDPKPAETSAKIEIKRETQTEKNSEVAAAAKRETVENSEIKTPEVAVTENKPETERVEPETREEKPEAAVVAETEKKEEKVENKAAEETKNASGDAAAPPNSNSVLPLKAEQLEKIELVVRFKDGKILTRPLSKVFSFNVNQGILTIILYDGTVSKYSFLDIEKVSVETGGN